MTHDPRHLDTKSLRSETRALRGLARSLVHDEHTAEDLAQETWVTAMDKPPKQGFSLSAWLRGITRNHARDAVRGQQRRQRREQLAAKSESVDSGDALERVDLLRHLLDHVRTLDEPFQSTVLQHYFDGIAPREIARREGVAPATIRTRLHRAILELRARMDASSSGDRRAWMAPLLVFANISDTGPFGGLVESCREGAGQVAQFGQHAVTAITMKKQAIGIAALAIAALGAGVWFWQGSSNVDPSRNDLSGSLGVGVEAVPDDEASVDLEAEKRAMPGERRVAAAKRLASAAGPGLTVRGTVRDSAGTAIAGATVVAFHLDSTQTAADGSYELTIQSLAYFDAAAKRAKLAGKASGSTRDGDSLAKAAAAQKRSGSKFKSNARDTGRELKKDLEIRAIMKGYTIASRTRSIPLSAFDGGKPVTIDFRLRTGFAVTGRVLDVELQPIAGATVSKWDRDFPPAISDENGYYRVEHLDPEQGERWLQARADGFVASWKRIQTPELIAGGRVATLNYVLTRGARLYGVVVAASGRRVAGAKLEIQAKPLIHAVSNDEGEFEFVGIRAGKVRLTTRHDDYAMVVQTVDAPPAGKELALTIELRPGATVSGTVVDERGEAIAYAAMNAWGDSGGLAATKAALDGTFELRGLPADGVSISCSATGYVSEILEDVVAPRRGLRIVLQRSARIAGHVVDAFTGQPVTKFRIRFAGSSPFGKGLGKPNATRLAKTTAKDAYPFYGKGRIFENDEGRWDTADVALPVGFVTDIEVRAEGFAPLEQREVRARIDMQHEALRLAVTPGTVLRGRVLATKTSLAIAGASLRALSGTAPAPVGGKGSRAPALARAKSDADGNFELSGVIGGKLRVVVEHDAHGTSVHEVVVPPGVREFDVTLRVDEQSTLRGVVLDSAGVASPNVPVNLTAIQVPGLGRKRWVTTSDARGRFEFKQLPKGRYQVARMQDSGGPKQLEALCRYVRIDKELHEVELSARGLATLHARFTSATSSMPSGLYIRIVAAADDNPQEPSRIAPRWVYVRDGSVVVEGLENGSYRCTSEVGSCDFEITSPGVLRRNYVLR